VQRTGPWLDSVEKATGNRVKFTRYYLSDIAGPPEYYDAVVKGRVDLALCAPLISPGRFPLLEVVDLPVPNLNGNHNGRLVWDLYQKYPEIQTEFKDVKVLWLHATPPKFLMFSKPVNKLEDLKGLKVAPTGKWGANVAAALGFTAVTINRDEVMMAVQTGVLSGAMAGWSSSPPGDKGGLSWGEALPYVVETPMGIAPYMMAMNLDKWNSLPADIKKIMEGLGGGNIIDTLDTEDVAIANQAKKDALAAYKLTPVTLTPAELDRWVKALAPLQTQFAADLDAKGLPGTKVVQDFNILNSQYAK